MHCVPLAQYPSAQALDCDRIGDCRHDSAWERVGFASLLPSSRYVLLHSTLMRPSGCKAEGIIPFEVLTVERVGAQRSGCAPPTATTLSQSHPAGCHYAGANRQHQRHQIESNFERYNGAPNYQLGNTSQLRSIRLLVCLSRVRQPAYQYRYTYLIMSRQ